MHILLTYFSKWCSFYYSQINLFTFTNGNIWIFSLLKQAVFSLNNRLLCRIKKIERKKYNDIFCWTTSICFQVDVKDDDVTPMAIFSLTYPYFVSFFPYYSFYFASTETLSECLCIIIQAYKYFVAVETSCFWYKGCWFLSQFSFHVHNGDKLV